MIFKSFCDPKNGELCLAISNISSRRWLAKMSYNNCRLEYFLIVLQTVDSMKEPVDLIGTYVIY